MLAALSDLSKAFPSAPILTLTGEAAEFEVSKSRISD